MRIVLVSIVDIAEPTGPTEHVVGLATGLQELGYQVALISPAAAGTAEPGLQDLHVVPSRPGAVARAMAVRRALRGMAVSNRRTAVYLRAFPYDWYFVARHLVKTGIPYFREINSLQFENYRALDMRRPIAVERRSEVLSLRNAAGWFPVTEELGRHARLLTGMSLPQEIALNGFDPTETEGGATRREVRERYGAGSRNVVAVMAGVSMPWHGVDVAVRTFDRLPDRYHLWLVGPRDRSQQRDIESQAAALGSRVQVVERQDSIGVTRLIRAADIGLGPLALHRKALTEAQPLKIGRYLGLGKPVVYNYADPRLEGHTIPGVIRVVGDDPNDLARAIESASQTDGEADRRQFAAEQLTWAAAARRTVRLIEQVLG